MNRSIVPAMWRALFFVLCAVALAGCPGDLGEVPGQEKIHVGDSRSKLVRIMGEPEYQRGDSEGEALQYCSTGFNGDAYRVYWVRDNKIVATTSYMYSSEMGFCSSRFSQLTWGDAPRSAREPEKKDKPKVVRETSGTGFFINGQGAIVTNARLVEGCKTITVGGSGTAAVHAVDVANDLAVLNVSNAASSPYANLDQSAVARLGEEVIVFGYPLGGELAGSGNLATGNISALAGPGNDIGRYQINATIQSGNSGGPLLDRSGNVLGVVVSKLDAGPEAVEIPQNVNFAAKGAFLKLFLKTNNVAYTEVAAGETLSIADVVALAQSFTVFIQCELDE